VFAGGLVAGRRADGEMSGFWVEELAMPAAEKLAAVSGAFLIAADTGGGWGSHATFCVKEDARPHCSRE